MKEKANSEIIRTSKNGGKLISSLYINGNANLSKPNTIKMRANTMNKLKLNQVKKYRQWLDDRKEGPM